MAAEFEPTPTQAAAWRRLGLRLLDILDDEETPPDERAVAQTMWLGLLDLIRLGPPKPGRFDSRP